MKLAIVDDQSGDAERLETLLTQWAHEKQVELTIRRYESGEAFLADFAPQQYGMVFMDIYLGGLNGIEIAKRLRGVDNACLLTFLTTSADHMAQAFPCHAFDYLEKPADRQRVFKLLDDALALLPEDERFIRLPEGRGDVRLRLNQLVSAESDGNYVTIRMADGRTRRQRMTFTEFTQMLGGDPRFLTPIRGVTLNMDYIDDLQGSRCVMTTGAVFPVKVRDGAKIEATLNQYRFDRLRTRQGRSEL